MFRAINGVEEDEWGLAEQLLAQVADINSLALWLKSQDAQRKPPRNRPKPIPRPGIEDDSKQTIGGDKLPVADMLEFLGPDYAVLVA